jgi:hypothetical protein
MSNIIEISKSSTPRLSVIGIGDEGSLKLKSPSTKTPLKSPGASQRSVNFGPGIEMLMNPKKNPTSPMKSDISAPDLAELDMKLNSLNKKELNKKIFSTPSLSQMPRPPSLKLNISELPTKSIGAMPSLGKKIQDPKRDVTWDGFKKFNNIPVNPQVHVPIKPKLNNEDTIRQKLSYIRKLEHLEKKGIKLTKKYTMEDPLAAIQHEFEMIKKEQEKHSSVKFQGKMMMAFVSALEFMNSKFDPFEIKLDGWAEAVNENIEDYDDVFGELHEKYGQKAKMAPEIKLLFMLGGSAAMLHMTNTMFKSSMPGMDDIMRQNPELMSQFTQAAANSMSKENPGFGGFMSGLMQQRGGGPPPPAPNMPSDFMGPGGHGPQGPDQQTRQNPPRLPREYSGGRRDVGMTRGSPSFGDAVNMEHRQGSDPFANDKKRRKKRPEMKGPSDLDDILSGLKTKKINLRDQEEAKSTVSMEEIQELNHPARSRHPKSKRKPRAQARKTGGLTMSLNI